jgi:XTP/dITP diphosphohydrolase
VKLVLATRNPHKVRELNDLMEPHEIEPLPDEVELPPETGTTFEENALAKARAAAELTGRAAIADDSGIAAEALEGAPGVWSARYAGEDATDQQNLDKLVENVPAGTNLAYVCALAYVDGTTEHVVTGRCEGTMATAARGTNGFGYDPVFQPHEHPDRTMAELEPAEKAAISHRGRAARALSEWLAG